MFRNRMSDNKKGKQVAIGLRWWDKEEVFSERVIASFAKSGMVQRKAWHDGRVKGLLVGQKPKSIHHCLSSVAEIYSFLLNETIAMHLQTYGAQNETALLTCFRDLLKKQNWKFGTKFPIPLKSFSYCCLSKCAPASRHFCCRDICLNWNENWPKRFGFLLQVLKDLSVHCGWTTISDWNAFSQRR